MARYVGPACRLCRRQGEKLMLKGDRCTSRKCAIDQRSLPPGRGRPQRRKISDRALQLREKQKARHTYGLMERQFRRHFAEAAKRPGVTGETMLQILEMRLDNVVFRLGFADSRRQARQIVCHGHISLNGRKTDIPSCVVKVGDVISWHERGTRTKFYEIMAEQISGKIVPEWLSLDNYTLSGRVMAAPNRNEIDHKIDEKVIVEYYSR